MIPLFPLRALSKLPIMHLRIVGPSGSAICVHKDRQSYEFQKFCLNRTAPVCSKLHTFTSWVLPVPYTASRLPSGKDLLFESCALERPQGALIYSTQQHTARPFGASSPFVTMVAFRAGVRLTWDNTFISGTSQSLSQHKSQSK
jgi:hypothetical protein